MASQPIPRLTEAEYLAIEERAECKSEFYNGEMFAMAGGSRAHYELEMSLSRLVGNLLEGSRCREYGPNTRVKAGDSGLYTYPDLSIACGAPQFMGGATDTLLNPIVLFEILSPSTENYDRAGKFLLYRQIESLKQYVLIAQDAPLVEVRTRNADETWTSAWYESLADICRIDSAGIALPLSAIYERVEFGPPTSPIPSAAER
jgi:Uma2 family endonuclease